MGEDRGMCEANRKISAYEREQCVIIIDDTHHVASGG